MYQDVLVPTDGSPGAEAAVGRALDLTRAFDGRVHALSVARPPEPAEALGETERAAARESSEERGHAATLRVQDRAEAAGVDVVREVREGAPHRAIEEYVGEAGIDLVVMGVHGRGGAGGGLGSTTERVLTTADVPVLVVADGADVDPGEGSYEDVVVPTDGSDVAERAAEQAITIAGRYGGTVHAVYVVDPTARDLEQLPRSVVGLLKEGGTNAVETIAAAARERNVPVTTAVLRGTPEDAILQYAGGVDADLIAMGTRGLAAGDDRFLGSTTARVVRRSAIPVLAVS